MKPELIDLRESIDVGGLSRWSRIYYKLSGNVLPDGYTQFMNMKDLDLRSFYSAMSQHFNVAASAQSWSVLAGSNGSALSFQNDRLWTVMVPLDAEQPLMTEIDGYPMEVARGWGLIAPPKTRVRLRPYSGQKITFAKYDMILQRSRGNRTQAGGKPASGGLLTHAFLGNNERGKLLELFDGKSGKDDPITPGDPLVDDLFERLRARMHETSPVKLVDQCFGHVSYRVTGAGNAWNRMGGIDSGEGMLASVLLSPATEGGIIRPAGQELRQMPGSAAFWFAGLYADVSEVVSGERKELIAVASMARR